MDFCSTVYRLPLDYMKETVIGARVDLNTTDLMIRDGPRFFDQVGHQIMSAYIENKHFLTKPCHRQTYQNYEQPPQSLQNLYFQSHFLALKINQIFLNFFSVKNI